MNINELIDRLELAPTAEDEAEAARILREAHRAGFITDDGKVRKVLGTLPVTRDGVFVGLNARVYTRPVDVFGNGAAIPLQSDDTEMKIKVPLSEASETGVVVRGTLDVADCYSCFQAADAAEAARGGEVEGRCGAMSDTLTIRNWLAVDDGWQITTRRGLRPWSIGRLTVHEACDMVEYTRYGRTVSEHPYQHARRDAVCAMPNGWSVGVDLTANRYVAMHKRPDVGPVSTAVTDAEVFDLFMLAKLARMAERACGVGEI